MASVHSLVGMTNDHLHLVLRYACADQPSNDGMPERV
jgi:hypothetical protein